VAQGAAQATEDAATLTAALEHFDTIPEALQAYECQRKPRAAYVARNTRVLQEWLHVYDGSARDSRDEMMRHNDASNPMFWGCRERCDWLFGHDATQIESESRIPDLPPLPPDDARVYKEFDEMRSRL